MESRALSSMTLPKQARKVSNLRAAYRQLHLLLGLPWVSEDKVLLGKLNQYLWVQEKREVFAVLQEAYSDLLVFPLQNYSSD